MHQYLDSDGSGTSPTCVSPTIGAERLQAATQWLQQNNLKGFLGEIGTGSNGEQCAVPTRTRGTDLLRPSRLYHGCPGCSVRDAAVWCLARCALVGCRSMVGDSKWSTRVSGHASSYSLCCSTSNRSSPQAVPLYPQSFRRHWSPSCESRCVEIWTVMCIFTFILIVYSRLSLEIKGMCDNDRFLVCLILKGAGTQRARRRGFTSEAEDKDV